MKKTIVKYPLLTIILIAILLRLPLMNGSFWLDEAAQALEIIRPLNQQLEIVADFQPPLLHLILHFAQYISRSEWFLRTIGALIPGIITIAYTYKIAEKLFSKKVAIIAGLLLATSSFHIYFSQELRPYSLATAIALVSMYYFSISLENSEKIPLSLTIINSLGLYTSYLYPFFMSAEIGYVLFTKKLKEAKNLLKSFGISILAFAPFLPIFFRQLVEGANVRSQLPGWDLVVSIPQLIALPLTLGKFIFGMLLLDLTPLIVFLTTLFGILAVGVAWYVYKNRNNFKFGLLLFWLLIPLLSAFIISFIVPVIQPKRLLYLLPGFYILIGYICEESLSKFQGFGLKNNNFKEKTAVFFLATTILINIIGTVAYYTNPLLQRENWRELQQQLHRDFTIKDTLLVYSFTDELAPMSWYEQNEKEKFPSLATKTLYIENVRDLPNVLKIAANYKTVLVFDYLRDLTDPNRKIDARLLELGFKEVGVLDYPNIGFVRIYMQPLSIIGKI